MGVTEIVGVISAVSTVALALIGLRINAAVGALEAKLAEERAKDRDEIKGWIEARYLPSREADARLTGLEQRSEDHERRLRRVEQRRNRRDGTGNN